MPGKATVPIIIADECDVMRTGLREMLRKNYPVLDAVHSHKLTEHLAMHPDGIVLLAADLPGLDLSAFTQLVKDKFPEACIILCIDHFKQEHLHHINKKHCAGYVLKKTNRRELGECIETAMQKRVFIGREIGAFMLRENANDEQPEAVFTEKELAVYYLLLQGKEVKEIADILHRSDDAVYQHQRAIFRKTNTNNATELLIYAFTKGWISKDDLLKWGRVIKERAFSKSGGKEKE